MWYVIFLVLALLGYAAFKIYDGHVKEAKREEERRQADIRRRKLAKIDPKVAAEIAEEDAFWESATRAAGRWLAAQQRQAPPHPANSSSESNRIDELQRALQTYIPVATRLQLENPDAAGIASAEIAQIESEIRRLTNGLSDSREISRLQRDLKNATALATREMFSNPDAAGQARSLAAGIESELRRLGA